MKVIDMYYVTVEIIVGHSNYIIIINYITRKHCVYILVHTLHVTKTKLTAREVHMYVGSKEYVFVNFLITRTMLT